MTIRIAYLPDGDDPGVGLLQVSTSAQQTRIQCTAVEYRQFQRARGRGILRRTLGKRKG